MTLLGGMRDWGSSFEVMIVVVIWGRERLEWEWVVEMGLEAFGSRRGEVEVVVASWDGWGWDIGLLVMIWPWLSIPLPP